MCHLQTTIHSGLRWNCFIQRMKCLTPPLTLRHGQRPSLGLEVSKKFQTNHGGTYLSHQFNQHLATNGTKQILTTHDTPTYNRVAERLNHVLLECTWAFLHSSALPKFCWGEAVKYTIWVEEQNKNLHTPKQQDPI